MRLRFIVLAVLVCVCGFVQAQDTPPVVIDYFFEAGCPDCQKVKYQVLPDLNERFEGLFQVNRHDVGDKEVIRKLFAYQEKLGITDNEPVCMVVDYQHVLNGFPAIKKRAIRVSPSQ